MNDTKDKEQGTKNKDSKSCKYICQIDDLYENRNIRIYPDISMTIRCNCGEVKIFERK